MIRFLRKAHTILYIASLFFFFILIFPFLYFFIKKPDRYFSQIVFLRKWMSLLATTVVGIRYKVISETPIDWSKPYVICPNHTSILDITALTYLCPQDFSFLGKVELLANPVTRYFFKSIDIVVDRSSKISAFKAFKKADQRLKENKSLVIFPEGKIDDEFPPRLHEFKSGSFRLAIDNKTDILPVVIENAWQILWDDGLKRGSRPGTVHIKILAPISTANLTEQEFEHLQDKVYEKMNSVWIKKNN